MINWGLSLCSHSPVRLFCPAFSKAGAQRLERYGPFLFAKLFLLGLFPQKKKRLSSLDTKGL